VKSSALTKSGSLSVYKSFGSPAGVAKQAHTYETMQSLIKEAFTGGSDTREPQNSPQSDSRTSAGAEDVQGQSNVGAATDMPEGYAGQHAASKDMASGRQVGQTINKKMDETVQRAKDQGMDKADQVKRSYVGSVDNANDGERAAHMPYS
jgi:hypothetical protein